MSARVTSNDDTVELVRQVKYSIAEARRSASSGEMNVLDLVNQRVDIDLTYVYVLKVLERIPGIGKVRSRAIMDNLEIDRRTTFSQLTESQRLSLISECEV